ncbi:hydrolase [Alteribacter lacisalsi]|nr:hydrolase [Alteribacter lacisalsi]
MMHLIIADLISDQLGGIDETSFYLGGIAPDAAVRKDRSHFFEGNEANYTRVVAYEKFLKKYNELRLHPYILGCYTHLIADQVWLTGFYLPWLRNLMKTNPDIHKSYHRDFHLLNGRLVEHYGNGSVLMRKLENNCPLMDLEEVTAEEVKAFIPYVKGDLDYEQKTLDEPLEVFTFEQITGYVETCVDRGVQAIRQLK